MTFHKKEHLLWQKISVMGLLSERFKLQGVQSSRVVFVDDFAGSQWLTHILQYNEHWSDSGLGGRWGENRGLCVFVCTPTTTPATASAPPVFPILSHPTLNPNILWVRYFFLRPDFHKTETSHSVVHCSCTTIIPHLIQPNPQYPLNLILFWNHFLQDWDITPPPPPATTPAPPLFPILSHTTPNILWLQKIYKTEISYFAVHLVNCPTRWSLLLIFGYLDWSSIFHIPDNKEI